MPVGDIITPVEYNDIQTQISNILGVGSGNVGYGQTVLSSQVSLNDSITVNEWGSLRNDIINIYLHQNNTIPDTSILPEAALGSTVRYNVTDAPVTVWDTLAPSLEAARINALPVGRFGTVNAGSQDTTVAFSTSASGSITFTWQNADAARFFFNGGGRLRITTSFAPSLNNSQNNTWQTSLDTIGTREWGGFFPDTGTSPTDGRNFFKSDGTLRQFFNQSVSSPYGMNNYYLDASKGSSGSNYIVTLRARLEDTYTDPPTGDPDNPLPNDLVQGTLTLIAAYAYPAGPTVGLGGATWIEHRPISVSIGSFTTT